MNCSLGICSGKQAVNVTVSSTAPNTLPYGYWIQSSNPITTTDNVLCNPTNFFLASNLGGSLIERYFYLFRSTEERLSMLSSAVFGYCYSAYMLFGNQTYASDGTPVSAGSQYSVQDRRATATNGASIRFTTKGLFVYIRCRWAKSEGRFVPLWLNSLWIECAGFYNLPHR